MFVSHSWTSSTRTFRTYIRRRQNGSFKPVWTTLENMLEPRTVTTPPTTTPPTTTPPTTTSPQSGAVLGPARWAVRVLGPVFYYDPAGT